MYSSKHGGPSETRTRTVLLPVDFESTASTNSAIRPCYYIVTALNLNISEIAFKILQTFEIPKLFTFLKLLTLPRRGVF